MIRRSALDRPGRRTASGGSCTWRTSSCAGGCAQQGWAVELGRLGDRAPHRQRRRGPGVGLDPVGPVLAGAATTSSACPGDGATPGCWPWSTCSGRCGSPAWFAAARRREPRRPPPERAAVSRAVRAALPAHLAVVRHGPPPPTRRRRPPSPRQQGVEERVREDPVRVEGVEPGAGRSQLSAATCPVR